MNATQWSKLEQLLDKAWNLPEEERETFLSEACGGDDALRAEAASLLAGRDDASAYFDHLAGAVLPSTLRQWHEQKTERCPADDSADPFRLAGRTVGHYKILSVLERGGMGIVYRARDVRLERPVALKFLPPRHSARDDAQRRFVVEAKAASALDHPNIAPVYEIGETAEGQLFIAMPCYEGETLRDKIARAPLPPAEAVRYAMQAARGLSAAHRRGIVHRDVKPANLFVTVEGVVKILDFGIAKVVGSDLTRSNVRLGTAAYMAPEQVRGEATDQRTDLWALGVVLYELLTGRRPFEGAYEQAILYAIEHEQPTPPGTLRTALPDALGQIIDACLAKDPNDRYQTADALRQDLARVQRHLDTGEAIVLAAPSSQTRRAAAAGATVLAAAVLLLWMVFVSPLGLPLGAGGVPAQKQIAVLPFTTIGESEGQQALSDGLVETLTSTLAGLERSQKALWVVPASEVRARGLTSAREAHKAFRVNLAVTGSVQLDGERVRLIVNLVDAETLRQLGSEIITARRTNATTLQDEVALKLAGLLGVDLSPQDRRLLTAGGTTEPGAYEFYLQGLGYLQRYEQPDNIDRALQLFERALQEDSAYALAHTGLAEAYWRKYEATREIQWADDAARHARRALTLDGALGRAHETLGLVYAGTGRYEEAVASFGRALRQDPASAAALRGLARAYVGLGRPDEAERTYQEAIQRRPDYWAGYNDLGVFYFQQDRFEDAIDQFLEVVALTPDNARGYSNLGALYFFRKRMDQAQTMFERSLALEPSYAAYSNLGTLYYADGRYADAAEMYEQALALEDSDHQVWGHLAMALEKTGERRRARDLFARAIRMAEAQRQVNPRDPELLCLLASYYGKTGAADKALALLDRALTMKPLSTDLLVLAAETYEHLGQRERALQWVGRALARGYAPGDLERSPDLDALRDDPRFQRLLTASPHDTDR